ncbi:alpha/beta-hydrolase [Macrolepiota fuliginosa MF-IS2]|uniref:Alpha/beta-hydrolase n=1 Tax=Macrolepiota fuliginosa MF-IS2 TaxID=1400762 RepID=A0A9P5XIH1_9AGAR|nr:alpha/beta-hydrolase [Macrolepiota fuliginosa MF-IS2]
MGPIFQSLQKKTSWERLQLTESQQRMYAAERLGNFRWICKMVATYSAYELKEEDIVNQDLTLWLREIGQFAEIIYATPPLESLLDNYDAMSQRGFPLEGYYALSPHPYPSSALPLSRTQRCSTLTSSGGDCTCARRRQQIIVSICGTASVQQAIQDLRAIRKVHPGASDSAVTVHTGFWDLYQGMKPALMEGIEVGLRTDPSEDELVVTGHSMGGAIAHLLCLDLLSPVSSTSRHTSLQVITFGEPRTGNQGLVDHWVELKRRHEEDLGIPIREWSVKAYNDGVPALPLITLGYRHFAQHPLYTINGKLYRIPHSEREFALFKESGELNVPCAAALAYQASLAAGNPRIPLSPLGGHNYYNERDLEGGFLRRLDWLMKSGFDKEGWEEKYRAIMEKYISA